MPVVGAGMNCRALTCLSYVTMLTFYGMKVNQNIVKKVFLTGKEEYTSNGEAEHKHFVCNCIYFVSYLGLCIFEGPSRL